MDFVVNLVFAVIGTVMQGWFGRIAWNMTIPTIFTGAPMITLAQAIVISFVVTIFAFDGVTHKDELADESAFVRGLNHVFKLFLSDVIMLGIVWLIMKLV